MLFLKSYLQSAHLLILIKRIEQEIIPVTWALIKCVWIFPFGYKDVVWDFLFAFLYSRQVQKWGKKMVLSSLRFQDTIQNKIDLI